MLKVVNISKKFGDSIVFKSISFEVNENDRLLIVGPSGGGKTTLLRCLNKLEIPDSGNVYLNGKNFKDLDDKYIRNKVGMVFQNYNLFPHLSAKRNVTLAPKLLKLGTDADIEEKAENLLEIVHILNKKDDYPKNLSGGEKQRVAIARTLATNPDILLFDEPTSALDPEVVKDFIELLKELSKTKTIIVVSHEMDLIKTYATKVLFLADNKILEYGTPSRIMKSKNEKVQKFFEQVK
jgi:ABC-type polar amino acid transport system ATPase subunit